MSGVDNIDDNLATTAATESDSDAKTSSAGRNDAESGGATPLHVATAVENATAQACGVATSTAQQGQVAETRIAAYDGVVSSVLLDATAPTAGVKDNEHSSLPVATDGLLEEMGVVIHAGAPGEDEELSAEKKKRKSKGKGMGNFGVFLPQLFGWDKRDKQDKPRPSRAGSVDDARPAAGNEEEGAASPVAETAAYVSSIAAATASVTDGLVKVGSDGAAAMGGRPASEGQTQAPKSSSPSSLLPFPKKELPSAADDGVAPAVMKVDDQSPSPSPSSSPSVAEQRTEQTSAGVDSESTVTVTLAEAGAAMGVEPLREEKDAPVLVAEGGVLNSTQQEEKEGPLLEAGDNDGRAPAAASSPPLPLTTAASLEDNSSSKKKKHQRGFSLPMLLGWGWGREEKDKDKDKTHTRAGSAGRYDDNGVTTAKAADGVSEPARVADNPPAATATAAAAEDGIVSAVADAMSDAVEVVSDAIETAAGTLAPGDVGHEQAQLPVTRDAGTATVGPLLFSRTAPFPL